MLFNGPLLLTLKSSESWVEEKMTSKTHWFTNAMRVYAADLICSTEVLGFQIFKLVVAQTASARLSEREIPGSILGD